MMALRKIRSIGTAVAVGILLVLGTLLWAGGTPAHATERSQGSAMAKCPECGTPWTPIIYDPTCTSTGFTTYICQECSHVELIEHADKLPHSWKQIASASPSCTEAGSVTNRCTVCGTTEKKETDPPLEHSYRSEVIAPTCSSIGYTLHTCKRCGDSYRTDQVGTADHTYSSTVLTEPTCHSVGLMRNICLVCGQYTTEEIPMVAHSWKTERVEPTHTAQGYTVYSCQYEGCGAVKREEFTDPLPYDMVWEEQAATCTADGIKVGYCKDGCGHTETVRLPYLGHDFGDWKVVYPASEDTDGLESHVCTRCAHTGTRALKYDPAIAEPEQMDPLLLGVVGFLLLMAVGVIVLCFLLVMEHAKRDESKRRLTPPKAPKMQTTDH